MYAAEPSRDTDWQTQLSGELRDPAFALSFREDLTHRLRRSYLALLLILLAAWTTRITLFEPAASWQQTAAMVAVSGEVVVGLTGLFYAVLITLTLLSARGPRVQEFQE